MGRVDPFTGYSIVLRTIVYVLVPAFTVWQFFRLRRAAHIYQLEAYKRGWFTRWVRENRRAALFLRDIESPKKELVMTGRVWRMVVAATVLTPLLILVPSGVVHISWGTPWDLITCAVMFSAVFFGAPYLLLAGDALMRPVQRIIDGRFIRRARGKLSEVAPAVVGVTGSYGKTSTKFAIERLAGSPDEVLATPASFNTTLGVVRAINEQLRPEHEVFVVEMGARQRGDIAELCDLVHPRIGVLTAVGPAHLETFGSLENIRRGKYELIEALPPDGTAVMNVDNAEVRTLADTTSHVEVIRYGLDEEGAPRVTARDVTTGTGGTSFTLVDTATGATVPVTTRLVGRHSLGHILAAAGVAIALGRDLGSLTDAIGSLEPVEHRLQIIEGAGGVTVIDDAYNSNPEGAAAALEVLAEMPARRRVVVSPGMVELGELQAEKNAEFAEHAARVADTVIFVAPLNRAALVEGARRAGRADVITVDSLTEATTRMQGLLAAGDVVLFENDLPDNLERS